MALTWSGVLLFFIMLFCGLLMAQATNGAIDDEHADYELRKWVYIYYGSGSRAFYTLFRVTLSGCWPEYSDRLIEEVNSLYVVFWLVYVLVVVFAVIRVVTALFLQQTMKIAHQDDELMMELKMAEKEAYFKKLKDFLAQSDDNGDGTMDLEELENLLDGEDIVKWLDMIGLEYHEVLGLFRVLDPGGGKVAHEDIIEGMIRLSGGVRAMDAVMQQHNQHKILQWLETLASQVASIVDAKPPLGLVQKKGRRISIPERSAALKCNMTAQIKAMEAWKDAHPVDELQRVASSASCRDE